MRLILSACLSLLLAACPGRENVPCIENTDCDLSTGGVCSMAATGNKWCAYPDPECESGYRYSDQDVGDGVGGVCTPENSFRHRLTVSIGGNGSGSITSEPPGLVCVSETCNGDFDPGTLVQLSPVPTSGSFLGWGDECSGRGACAVTMDQDRAVAALFGMPGEALWATPFSGPSEEFGAGIAMDGEGNLLAVGIFAGSISVGGFTLTSAGVFDIYVAKLSASTGDVLWAKQFGGAASDAGRGVAVDAANNVYVIGQFRGNVDFGGGPLVSASNTDDVFVLKLTPDGNFAWARAIGGAGIDTGDGISVRGNSVVAAGTYSGSMSVGATTVTSAGSVDVFAISLTTDGGDTWLKSYGGTEADVASGIAIDGVDNIVITGRFKGTVNYGGGPLVSAGNFDAFLLKISGGTGAHLMSRRFGSAAYDEGSAITVDSAANILLVGTFRETVDFGQGPVTASSPGHPDIFLAKYSQAGSCLWAKAFGGGMPGATARKGNGVAVNGAGDVAIAGAFDGSMTFGGAVLSSASEFGTDLFAARFAGADGAHLNSIRAGGMDVENASGIAHAADGRFFVTGSFSGFADFGGEALTSAGGHDAYVLALAPL
ncbi:MAG: SBBP repeat-containing protein [Kofleriaceae bacterium]